MGEGQTSASAPSVHKSAVTDCRAAVILLTALGVQSVVVQSAHTDGDPESHHPGSLWPVCNRAGGSSRKNHLGNRDDERLVGVYHPLLHRPTDVGQGWVHGQLDSPHSEVI